MYMIFPKIEKGFRKKMHGCKSELMVDCFYRGLLTTRKQIRTWICSTGISTVDIMGYDITLLVTYLMYSQKVNTSFPRQNLFRPWNHITFSVRLHYALEVRLAVRHVACPARCPLSSNLRYGCVCLRLFVLTHPVWRHAPLCEHPMRQ